MNVQIHIEPEYRELLARNGLSDFDTIMHRPCGPAASRHKDRATVCISLSDGQELRRFYLKRVYHVPFRHILADVLRCRRPEPQPIREAQAIARLESCGLGVMRAAAWGQRREWGCPRQAFLLVEEVPGRRTLLEALHEWAASPADPIRRRERATAAVEFGAFVRKLHQMRLSYPDLTAKHVFLRPAGTRPGSGRWQFCLIDVERVSERASGRARRGDLRILLRRIRSGPIRRSDLLRFAEGYTGCIGRPWPERKRRIRRQFAWASSVWQDLGRACRNRPRQPDELAGLAGREDFLRIGRVVVNRRFASLLAENGFTGLRSVFAFEGGQRLDKPGLDGWRRRIRLMLRSATGEQRCCYLKRYEHPPWRAQLERILTKRPDRSTAWWEWRQARELARLFVPTITLMAYGERMRGWIERRSFILTEAVAGESLERWVPSAWPDHRRDTARRRELIDQLACVVATLHGAGLVHRDLYLSHIFISQNRDGRFVLRLIDLQRVFRPRFRRGRWIVKDLAALNYSCPRGLVSRTDRIRWLRRYLGVDKLTAEHKRLVRRVVAKTARIARHEERRARRRRRSSRGSPT